MKKKPINFAKMYKKATPYPHIVMDGFLPFPVANSVADELESGEGIAWQQFSNSRESKKAFSAVSSLPATFSSTKALIESMCSDQALRHLEEITGIPKLYADPSLMGGGLHRIERGGHFGIHTDFNFHPHLKKTRKVNVLIFLSREWEDIWGGHLELWTRDMMECALRVVPIFNRAVIFTIDDTSWHGHPHPMMCPEGKARKSIALYYYTDGMPENIHSTIFQEVNKDGYTNTTVI